MHRPLLTRSTLFRDNLAENSTCNLCNADVKGTSSASIIVTVNSSNKVPLTKFCPTLMTLQTSLMITLQILGRL